MNLSDLIYVVPAALIAIIGHEYAHGYVSWKLGDPTPKQDGRLSFNPLNHLDPIGTLFLIIFHFGWAKPVRINSYYYKDRKKGVMMTALAGPVANFVMAMISVLIMQVLYCVAKTYINQVMVYMYTLFNYLALLNIGLGVFNLIPVPPLDGSKVFSALIYNDETYIERHVNRYGYIVLMILAATGILSIPISIAQKYIYQFFMAIAKLLIRF